VLIVFLVIIGSVWVIANLNSNIICQCQCNARTPPQISGICRRVRRAIDFTAGQSSPRRSVNANPIRRCRYPTAFTSLAGGFLRSAIASAPATQTASSSGSSSQMPPPRERCPSHAAGTLGASVCDRLSSFPLKNTDVFESHCAVGLCGGEARGFKDLGAAAGGVDSAVGCG
jgi:hypothetical protein